MSDSVASRVVAPAALLLAIFLAHAARAAAPDAGAPRGADDPAPPDPRALRVELGGEGEVALLRGADPRPIRGAGIYRAVLRPDLLEAHERARVTRVFLFVGAATLALGGPAVGYALGDARGRPLHLCHNLPVNSAALGLCRIANEELSRDNARTRRRGLRAGLAVGAAAGVGLAWAGFSVRPHLPGLDEARALVERYNDRLKPLEAPEPRGMLLLEPTRGGARLVLAVKL